MSFVAIKNLVTGGGPNSSNNKVPRPRPAPNDLESARTPLLQSSTPAARSHPDYSTLETDFTHSHPRRPGPAQRYNSDFSKTDCPVYNCPRRRPIHRHTTDGPHDDEEGGDEGKGWKRWVGPRTVSDAIIGLSDGLTVPFALTAGLSAFNDTRVVVYGGVAELIAGSISMGLGGWLAGRGEAQFYETTLRSTRELVKNQPNKATELIFGVFDPYDLPSCAVEPLASSLIANDSSATVDFLMSFHHSLPPPGDTKRTPLISALTIALGYFLGGFVPLLPYFFVGREEVMTGLCWSVGVMGVCLFLFGVGRQVLVGEEEEGGVQGKARMEVWWGRCRGGLEMCVIGGAAAGASWGIVRGLERG